MRIQMIACQVFNRELSYFCSQSKNIIDITWLPQGLHDTPDLLRKMLVEAVEKIEKKYQAGEFKHQPDAIALGYGLCSNGIVGVQAYSIPIVVPRTDDCIGVFLGSQKRYLDLFQTYSGTYWLNNGWIETAFIPSKEMLAQKREKYAEDYGEDNADFLMEQDLLWAKNYKYCGYIDSPVYKNPEYPKIAQQVAEYNGWDTACFQGDSRLLKKLTDGDWDEEEFLVCPPGYRIEAAYDGKKVKATAV